MAKKGSVFDKELSKILIEQNLATILLLFIEN